MKKYFKANGFSVVSVLVLMLMVTQNTKVNAQVYTRVLDDKGSLLEYLPSLTMKGIPTYAQEEINFEREEAEDIKSGKTNPRFAVKTSKDYSQIHGKWSETDENMVWSIKFDAKARSLNFLIKDFNLPKGAKMYVYSIKNKIIHGPVEPNHFTNKHYSTDIIDGDECYISIYCLKENYKELNLNIYAVCQGFLFKKNGSRAFQDAANCHFDVNCAPIGNGWGNERDAVAQILMNGTEQCTGSLLNDECLDLAPNFLTAFHCLDDNGNGILEQGERNLVNNWAFRFNYQSASPACTGNSTNTGAAQWILYNGSTFLSAFEPSDMALVRLNQNIIDQPTIAFAGWNRAVAAATNATAIHHPAGDVKKISIDNNALVGVAFQGGPTDHWRATFDQGLVQHGSSGSPLFDQNHRVVGQLHGNQNNTCQLGNTPQTENCWCNTQVPIGEYGRFDVSWDRAGSAANSRLRDWLTNNNPGAIIMNTIRVPSVNVPNALQYICSASNSTISLNNPIPGRVLSWSVSNPALFSTSGGSSTAGTTANAVLRANNATTSGSAILTFTMTLNGCNVVTITRPLWVGIPSIPSTNPHGNPLINIGVSQQQSINITSAAGSPNLLGTWSSSGSVSTPSTPPSQYKTYTGDYEGNGSFHVYTSNTCGDSFEKSGGFNVSDYCNPCPKIKINNPVSHEMHCEIPISDLPIENQNNIDGIRGIITITSQNGEQVLSETFKTNLHKTSVESISSGIYIVKMKIGKKEYIEKAIIIH